MAASEVSICNLALGWLAGNLITSLNDDSNEAKLCKANYELLRDSVLEAVAWTFATKRFRLIPELNVPAWGYESQFTIPAEVLNVLEVTDLPIMPNGANSLDWRREENRILANEKAIYIKAIIRITDPTRFTPNFVQALASRIAAEIAVPLTESKDLMMSMQGKYQDRLLTAANTDGMQGKSDIFDARQLVDAR